MDYYTYSKDSTQLGYLDLILNFDRISDVLLKKLNQFERDGFDPSNGFVFGFSMGAQLAINTGRRFHGKLDAIDGKLYFIVSCVLSKPLCTLILIFSYLACEPAAPGFYPNPFYQSRGSPKLAAKNVQTIHTSINYGSLERDSHQDWLMGNCGADQPGAPYRKTFISIGVEHDNHIMCPTFYVNAFENNFLAAPNDNCFNNGRDVSPVPTNFSMGYRQTNKGYAGYACLCLF